MRKKFITDIIVAINQLQADGYDILLSLDANETMGQDSSHGINSLLEDCTLHDLHLSNPSPPPATYKYGHHRRIDYMLGSEAVFASVTALVIWLTIMESSLNTVRYLLTLTFTL